MQRPKIFISYSWKPEENKEKVHELAERLSTDGIHVILDIWDLREGQDKYQFMEQMVNDPEIIKVLLICNKEYTQKANQKKGGVGVESLIISDEIYSQAKQEKFIPVLVEYDDDNNPYMPTFVKTRIYIDLSSEDHYENEYEKLVRNIYNKPLFARPSIGTPPAYVEEDKPVFLRTAHKIKVIKNGLLQNKDNTQILIKDYYETFVASLKDFQLEQEIENPKDIDELFLKKIEELKYLRDDFIDFFQTVIKLSTKIDIEALHLFFEKLLSYYENYESNDYPSSTIGAYRGDHIAFFLYEVFLYSSAILLKEEKFEELAFLLHTPFLVAKPHSNLEPLRYFSFNNQVGVLDYRNKKLNLRKISPTADELKQRATAEKIHFIDIQEVDILL